MYIPPSFENNLLLPRPVLSIALYFQCSAMQPLAILEIEKSLHNYAERPTEADSRRFVIK